MAHTTEDLSVNLCSRVLEFLFRLWGRSTKDSGWKVFRREREGRSFLTVTLMRGSFIMVKNKVRECLNGVTAEFMKVSSKMEWCTEEENFMLAISSTSKGTSFKTERSDKIKSWKLLKAPTLALFRTIWSEVNLSGRIRLCMRGSSRMGCLMVRELWYILRVEF